MLSPFSLCSLLLVVSGWIRGSGIWGLALGDHISWSWLDTWRLVPSISSSLWGLEKTFWQFTGKVGRKWHSYWEVMWFQGHILKYPLRVPLCSWHWNISCYLVSTSDHSLHVIPIFEYWWRITLNKQTNQPLPTFLKKSLTVCTPGWAYVCACLWLICLLQFLLPKKSFLANCSGA